jgi:hypothetical protein
MPKVTPNALTSCREKRKADTCYEYSKYNQSQPQLLFTEVQVGKAPTSTGNKDCTPTGRNPEVVRGRQTRSTPRSADLCRPPSECSDSHIGTPRQTCQAVNQSTSTIFYKSMTLFPTIEELLRSHNMKSQPLIAEPLGLATLGKVFDFPPPYS